MAKFFKMLEKKLKICMNLAFLASGCSSVATNNHSLLGLGGGGAPGADGEEREW